MSRKNDFYSDYFDTFFSADGKDKDVNNILGYIPVKFKENYGFDGAMARIVELAMIKKMEGQINKFAFYTGYELPLFDFSSHEAILLINSIEMLREKTTEKKRQFESMLRDYEEMAEGDKSVWAFDGKVSARDAVIKAEERQKVLKSNIESASDVMNLIQCASNTLYTLVCNHFSDDCLLELKLQFKTKCHQVDDYSFEIYRSHVEACRVVIEHLTAVNDSMKKIFAKMEQVKDKFTHSGTHSIKAKAAKAYYSVSGEHIRTAMTFEEYLSGVISNIDKAIHREMKMKASLSFI